MILVGCDNYELVNTDEYRVVNTDEYYVVKKNEVRNFESKIQWSGLNISTNLEVKHLDGMFYFKISVEDLEGESIQETDYFENLLKGGLILYIQDKDGFQIVNEMVLPINLFDNEIGKGNKEHALVEQGSFVMKETTYIQIGEIKVGTSQI